MSFLLNFVHVLIVVLLNTASSNFLNHYIKLVWFMHKMLWLLSWMVVSFVNCHMTEITILLENGTWKLFYCLSSWGPVSCICSPNLSWLVTGSSFIPHTNSAELADCALSACLCLDFALSWPSLNVLYISWIGRCICVGQVTYYLTPLPLNKCWIQWLKMSSIDHYLGHFKRKFLFGLLWAILVQDESCTYINIKLVFTFSNFCGITLR